MPIRVSRTRVDLDDQTLQKPVLRDYGETRIAENSGTAYTIDLTRGNVYEVTLTGNVTFTFSNPPASGTAGSFTLIAKQDTTGARTTTWPSSVKWANGGAAPTLGTNAKEVNIFTFLTTDAGTTWWGFLGGLDVRDPAGSMLYAWGDNTDGRLGVGDVATRSSPVQVGALATWTSAVGAQAILAIKPDGTIWSWGLNDVGQLGLGDVASRSSPVQVGALTTWTAINADSGHSLALRRK